MNAMHNTPMPTEERGSGEPDEPGSSADADVPPEPTGNSIQVIAAPSLRSPVPDAAVIRDGLARAAKLIEPTVERVSVMIVDDAEMTALHHRHCAIDETTDVLTFPMNEPGDPIDADIAICADVAARRAESLGHAVERELLLYALHGLLHCCGYDDHDEEQYGRMHAEEDRILNAIGVGAVFAPGITPVPGSENKDGGAAP